MRRFPPERIVCLTEETVETLYLLGQEHRLVGVSGYAVRPKRVRQEGPPGAHRRTAGLGAIPAVAQGRITEIKSPLILQPGPAALTEGLDAIAAALA